MKALVVAHDHVSPPGPIGERFAQRGYTLDHHVVVAAEHYEAPGVTPAFPEFSDYDAVVLLGAPWSVYDTARTGP